MRKTALISNLLYMHHTSDHTACCHAVFFRRDIPYYFIHSHPLPFSILLWHCSSFLLSYKKYEQTPIPYGSDAPYLWYEILDVKVDSIYDECVAHCLNQYLYHANWINDIYPDCKWLICKNNYIFHILSNGTQVNCFGYPGNYQLSFCLEDGTRLLDLWDQVFFYNQTINPGNTSDTQKIENDSSTINLTNTSLSESLRFHKCLREFRNFPESTKTGEISMLICQFLLFYAFTYLYRYIFFICDFCIYKRYHLKFSSVKLSYILRFQISRIHP